MAANPTAGWRSIVQQVEHVGHPRLIFLVPPAAAGLDADGHLPGVHTSGHEVGLIVVEIPKFDRCDFGCWFNKHCRCEALTLFQPAPRGQSRLCGRRGCRSAGVQHFRPVQSRASGWARYPNQILSLRGQEKSVVCLKKLLHFPRIAFRGFPTTTAAYACASGSFNRVRRGEGCE